MIYYLGLKLLNFEKSYYWNFMGTKISHWQEYGIKIKEKSTKFLYFFFLLLAVLFSKGIVFINYKKKTKLSTLKSSTNISIKLINKCMYTFIYLYHCQQYYNKITK